MYGAMSGAARPAKLPIMFIDPDSVPANLPPTSMQAPQAFGITRSLQKLAIPMASIAGNGEPSWVAVYIKVAAPAKPIVDIMRRALRVLLIFAANRGEMKPENMAPMPPKNSG